MKVIAMMTPKGGVGKTTTATTIAYVLGKEMGARELIVDADPQEIGRASCRERV